MRRSIVSVAVAASLLLGASLAAEAATSATAATPVAATTPTATKIAATKDCSKLKTKKAQKRCAAKQKSGDSGANSTPAPTTGSNPK